MRRRWLLVALAGCFTGDGDPFPMFSAAAFAEAADQAAPVVSLVANYRTEIDPSPFLVSEKYDGVRAIWDGGSLRFRSGRRVAAPAWFLAALPREPLDGELWLGRGRFDELSGIVRRSQPGDDQWREIRYMVFDLPGGAGSFSDRAERLRQIVAAVPVPWLAVAPQERIENRADLMRKLDALVAAGGEGLVLHRADSTYQAGRSDDLLKLKPWHDAEATVVAHEPGRGRLLGMIGALRVRTAEGKEFRIGSGLSDALRRDPPAVGTSVTFRYQELTKAGIPRFPRYWRKYEAF
jgi:DNA ligase-1